MLKRITKITSLLVCAASVISIVPTMAADIQTIETQEGTIYSVASKKGLFYIDGEINGQDEAQYYVGKDGKFNKLDIDTDYYVKDLLQDKYLELTDEETYLDVTDGYKEANVSRQEFIDNVEKTLKKKIKHDNDGRFLDSDYEGSALQEIKDYKGKAGDLLSGGSGLSVIKYHLANADKLANAGINKYTSAIYTDYEGNYVDADYNIGSLRVNTTTGGSVTIKNTDEIYNGSTDYQYKAMISEPTDYKGYITETKGSIYRFANLSIYGKKKSDSTWTNITSDVEFGGKKYKLDSSSINSNGSITVLHRFTRTTPATDTIDGIKYAKDASIYFFADEDGKSEYVLGRPKHDGITDANKKVGAAIDGSRKFVISENGINSGYYANGKVYSEQITLKTKNGFGYMDIGKEGNIDDVNEWADTGGAIYVLRGGYLRSWNLSDGSFTKLYRVDSSMNNIKFMDKDNFLLWNKDNEIYSIVNKPAVVNKPVATTSEAVTVATTVTAGWAKAADGTWSYNKADGTKATGWLKDGSAWYYLNASGGMQTGWLNDNGSWYYLNASGAMLSNTTIDGYLLGANGAWIK
jgi:FOG: Glucan-binding domain (YG repeat)